MIQRKNVLFTGQELYKVMDFLQNKTTISLKELQQTFNRDYTWASQIMQTLEELYIVDEFKGERDRVILKI